MLTVRRIRPTELAVQLLVSQPAQQEGDPDEPAARSASTTVTDAPTGATDRQRFRPADAATTAASAAPPQQAHVRQPAGHGPAGRPTGAGDLTPELIDTDIWTDEMVARAGIPIIDTKFVTVGGGIGSFVTVDFLRIYGVPASDITVLTQLETPWSSYEYLTRVSQIPRGERLRSDSKSTPDNIWGFPSYAVREAFGAKSVKGFVAPLWNVLTEPILSRLLHPEGRPGLRDDGARARPDRLPAVRPQGPGPDDPAPPRGRLLHHPDAAAGRDPDPAARLPQPVRARGDRLPGAQAAARPAALPRVLPGSVQGGQRLRAARARLPATRPAARARW